MSGLTLGFAPAGDWSVLGDRTILSIPGPASPLWMRPDAWHGDCIGESRRKPMNKLSPWILALWTLSSSVTAAPENLPDPGRIRKCLNDAGFLVQEGAFAFADIEACAE